MTDWRYAAKIAALPSIPLGLSHLLPSQAGLYIVLISSDQGDAFVGYVGIAAASLYQRWNAHRGVGGKSNALEALARSVRLGDRPVFVTIHYDVRVRGVALREAEAQIIEAWNPPLNAPLWGKGGSPILITPAPGWGAWSTRRHPVYVTPQIPARLRIDCHDIIKHMQKGIAHAPSRRSARS